jgi:sugar phosphate permease
MEFDQSTRRWFITLLGCAGAIASLLAGCTSDDLLCSEKGESRRAQDYQS